MRKVLSVLCMALLAGGMIFTSCTKQFTITVEANPANAGTVTGGGTFNDQATTVLTATPNAGYQFVKWQDGNTQNPRTITVSANETYTAIFEAIPQNETKITFNGTSWVAANAIGIDKTAENWIYFYFFKVANSQENPYCEGALESVPVTNATNESTGGDNMNYRDPDYTYYDETGVLGQGEGVTFWGWNAINSTFVENITAVDLNALTISGDWSVQVGDVATYAETGDWGTLKPFTGKMTNATWTMQQATKGEVTKAKANKLAVVK